MRPEFEQFLARVEPADALRLRPYRRADGREVLLCEVCDTRTVNGQRRYVLRSRGPRSKGAVTIFIHGADELDAVLRRVLDLELRELGEDVA